MEDTVSPTPEWLSKHTYEPPQVDQTTIRRAYRKISVFDELHNRGEIEYSQLRAAEKLEKHWHGAQGANVRMCDETSDGTAPEEYARSYHAQTLSKAQKVLRPKEWLALVDIIMGATVEQVGRKWRAVGTPKIARAQGLVLVCEGLEQLSELWGFRTK